MTTDRGAIRDEVQLTLDRVRERFDPVGIRGCVELALTRPRRSAAGLEVIQYVLVPNLVTQVGDEYYGERAAGIGSPPDQVTGMRLGTGTTAAAKTGAGAAIVTYISGSNQAIEGGFPTSSIPASARRIQWQSIWAAGDSTNSAITESVITNETPLTDVAGSAANTIARVVFSAINKGALDTLTNTWSHDLLGA
jgi:hypothetical protein